MNNNDVSIIIPNWNGETLLSVNLPKVIEAAKGCEIIVVDDASSDKSLKLLETQFPEVIVLSHVKNKGFGESCNDGVKIAKGKIIVLLNTDVIPENNFLKPVLVHFNDPKIFAVSLGETSSGPGIAVFEKGFIELVRQTHRNKSCYSFWASGGQSAYLKEKWLELGGFDSLYKPFYWEDVDLSYRAWKRGYRVVWEPEARVVHRHKGTINTHFSKKYIDFIGERNRLFFIWKNITDTEMFKAHKIYLLKKLNKLWYWKILLSILPKIPLILSKRKSQRQESLVSDKSIFQLIKKSTP